MGLEEGAEVAAHEMGHAYVQHAPVKRASHVQKCVQVLLHGGNTAGLAYSITICPALPYCAVMISVVVSRLSCTNKQADKGSNRPREDGTWNLTAIGSPGSGGSGDGWGAEQTMSSLPALPAPMETRFCAGRVRSGAMLQVLEYCGEMRQTARIGRDCPYGILRTVVPVVCATLHRQAAVYSRIPIL